MKGLGRRSPQPENDLNNKFQVIWMPLLAARFTQDTEKKSFIYGKADFRLDRFEKQISVNRQKRFTHATVLHHA